MSKRVGIYPYPERESYSLTDGERSELVFIAQLMLNAIGLSYDIPPLPVSGIYDEATATAVTRFQEASRLPVTGEIDFITWDRLAEEYNLTVNDNQ